MKIRILTPNKVSGNDKGYTKIFVDDKELPKVTRISLEIDCDNIPYLTIDRLVTDINDNLIIYKNVVESSHRLLFTGQVILEGELLGSLEET